MYFLIYAVGFLADIGGLYSISLAIFLYLLWQVSELLLLIFPVSLLIFFCNPEDG